MLGRMVPGRMVLGRMIIGFWVLWSGGRDSVLENHGPRLSDARSRPRNVTIFTGWPADPSARDAPKGVSLTRAIVDNYRGCPPDRLCSRHATSSPFPGSNPHRCGAGTRIPSPTGDLSVELIDDRVCFRPTGGGENCGSTLPGNYAIFVVFSPDGQKLLVVTGPVWAAAGYVFDPADASTRVLGRTARNWP